MTLYESSDRFGGFGTFFEDEARILQRFYHVLLPDDDHLLGRLLTSGRQMQFIGET